MFIVWTIIGPHLNKLCNYWIMKLFRNDFSSFMFIFFPCPLPCDHICDQKKDLLQQFAVFVRSKKILWSKKKIRGKNKQQKRSMYICLGIHISFSQDFDFRKNRFWRWKNSEKIYNWSQWGSPELTKMMTKEWYWGVFFNVRGLDFNDMMIWYLFVAHLNIYILYLDIYILYRCKCHIVSSILFLWYNEN